MTRLEIQTRVRYNLREATASVWTDAELQAQINLAQRYIATQLDESYLTELIQLQSYTITVPENIIDTDALPADYIKVVGDGYNVDTDVIFSLKTPEVGRRLRAISANDVDYSARFMWVEGTNLNIMSRKEDYTSDAFEYYVLCYPNDLALDGTESEINDSVIDLVIDYATARALVKTDLESSIALEAKVRGRIKELNSELR